MDTDDGPERYALPATLDARAAALLAQELRGRVGHDLVLDASDVQRLGAQCLAVLLAARRKWDVDGMSLQIAAGSEPFVWAVSLMGARDALMQPAEDMV